MGAVVSVVVIAVIAAVVVGALYFTGQFGGLGGGGGEEGDTSEKGAGCAEDAEIVSSNVVLDQCGTVEDCGDRFQRFQDGYREVLNAKWAHARATCFSKLVPPYWDLLQCSCKACVRQQKCAQDCKMTYDAIAAKVCDEVAPE